MLVFVENSLRILQAKRSAEVLVVEGLEEAEVEYIPVVRTVAVAAAVGSVLEKTHTGLVQSAAALEEASFVLDMNLGHNLPGLHFFVLGYRGRSVSLDAVGRLERSAEIHKVKR